MDRQQFYPGQVPLSAHFLTAERSKMVGLGYAMQAILGTNTIVDGLDCVPTTPTTLTIQVTAGQIYQIANLDGSIYGTLPPDIEHNILKQGLNLDTWTATLSPPTTAGQAVNYLIQAALLEADTDNTVLPYVNSANPSQPFTGPNGSGTAQPTKRRCTVALSQKSGIAAASGSQVTPSPDPGYVALYVVTVTYGQTQITGPDITRHTLAPFLYKKLPELPSWVQAGEFAWGDDTGTANAIVANLTPAPAAYTKGMHFFVKKVGSANSGNVTLNLNGLGAVAALDANGAQIGSGNLPANMVMHFVFDGSACRLMNGSTTQTTVSSLTGVSGEGVAVDGTNHINLNFPGLTADNPTALDLFAFYDNEGAHHKNIQWQNLLLLIAGSLTTGLLNMQVITTSGTYAKTPGTRRAIAIAVGGGGGGAGVGDLVSSAGGAGATAIAFVDLTSITSVSCTIGTGGAGGRVSVGGDGGETSFGAYAVAGGGKGGQGSVEGLPGLGGTASVGLLKIKGGGGMGALQACGGTGGSSFLGGGGAGGNWSFSRVTGDSGGYGGGGGGGDGGGRGGLSTGGAGGDGVIWVIEFA